MQTAPKAKATPTAREASKPTKPPDTMEEYPVTALLGPSNDAVLVGRVGVVELLDGVHLRLQVAMAPPGLHPVFLVSGEDCSKFDRIEAPPAGDQASEGSDGGSAPRPGAASPDRAPLGRIGASDPGGEGLGEFFLAGKTMEDDGAESVLNKLLIIAKAADVELERTYRPNELASGPRVPASDTPPGRAAKNDSDATSSLAEKLLPTRVIGCAKLTP